MECFPGHRSTGSILKDRKAEALTLRQLREWIEREIHLYQKNAPFDTGDANLLSAAGAIRETRIYCLQRAHVPHARNGPGTIHFYSRRSRTGRGAPILPATKRKSKRSFSCGSAP